MTGIFKGDLPPDVAIEVALRPYDAVPIGRPILLVEVGVRVYSTGAVYALTADDAVEWDDITSDDDKQATFTQVLARIPVPLPMDLSGATVIALDAGPDDEDADTFDEEPVAANADEPAPA